MAADEVSVREKTIHNSMTIYAFSNIDSSRMPVNSPVMTGGKPH
ncbi:MAG: hypothetical protein ACTSWP_10265 [Candidatus Freyarchaeota archaeon]|nr:hypothetical protein [Candidatus Freyrarchaeum guaymaensis]